MPSSSCSRSCSTGRTSARSRTPSTTATPSTSPTARRPSGCRTSPSRPGWSSSRRCTRRTTRPRASTTTRPPSSTPDGTYLGKYRKTHIPHVKGFWEKFYFRPGNLGYPVFETAVGKIGVYICYDRHFPEGARALGLNGAEIVLIPSATSRGLSEYLWRIEQVSHAVANGYYVGTINRVGIEADIGDDDFYGQSYFVDPRGQFVGDVGSAHDEELIIRDLDLDRITEVRNTWQFFRDRRPDAYEDLTRP